MKILQVCPRYPPHTGGVEKHVRKISEGLSTKGHEVVVRTADALEDGKRWEVRNGVEVRRHAGFAPGEAFHLAPGILPAVRRTEADVVHAHNYHSFPLLFAALGTAEQPLVATMHYHGGSTSGFRDRLLSLYQPLGTWGVRQADEVIAVSDWERSELKSDFGVEASVIPNGVDAARFADAKSESRHRPYLLCVGRLEDYKGIQHAIRAMEELDGFDLLVAGSGPYGERLQSVARESGVEGQVEFLGYVESERLPGLYAGASAYLNLSEYEAYGMTVAEAIASGTPCVVRKSGALIDWVDNEGCVGIDETDREAVANAVRRVVDREPDTSILQTWGEVTDQLERKYNSVLTP